jgi:polysaccharide export outer membrane protein
MRFTLPRLSSKYYFLALSSFIATLPSNSFGDEYTVRKGDSLQIDVSSLSMQKKTVVGVDGNLSLPIGGDIKADGVELTELLKAIRARISSKQYVFRGTDGREVLTAISPDEISVYIVDFRPIYVNGDVAKPGELSFRPGMTVEKAIALAGGYDLTHFKLDNPFIAAIDFKGDYAAAWIDVVRLEARAKAISSELKQNFEHVASDGMPEPLTKEKKEEIVKLQNSEVKKRKEAYVGQRDSFSMQIAALDERIKTLKDQALKESEGARFDNSEEQRISELVQKGNASVGRIADARRLSLLSATRALQVNAQAQQTEKERLDVNVQIKRLDLEWVVYLNSELEETRNKLDKSVNLRKTNWDKYVYTGALRSQLSAWSGDRTKFWISREVDGVTNRLNASADSKVEPGDLVQIQLQLDTK